MHRPVRSVRALVATLLVAGLVVASVPAAPGPGRLEGRVVGLDGRPAAGYTVHLVDESGVARETSPVDGDGLYGFAEVPPGRYGLGVENAAGRLAPVAGPAVRVGNGELVRRDVKLMLADDASRGAALDGNASMGLWWAGLSRPAKAWSVVALVVAVGVTAAALSGDNEPEASPSGSD